MLTINTTINSIFVCIILFNCGAALADQDDLSLPGSRSPLLPDFYPATGKWISESNYSEMESKFGTNSALKLTKFDQTLRFGVSDQTEIFIKQEYAIQSDFGAIGELYNPTIGTRYRLNQSDSDHIYLLGLAVRPEVSYAGINQYSTDQQIFGKYSWKVEDDVWISVTANYLNSYFPLLSAHTETIIFQFNASKSWNRTTSLVGLNLSQQFNSTGRFFQNSPNLINKHESNVSPTLIGALSYNFGKGLHGIVDYSFQTFTRTTSTFFNNVYQFSNTSTTTTQTVSARLVKEF